MTSPEFYSGPTIRLEVAGWTPNAFKNRKRLVSPKNGRRPMLITDPKVKKQMDFLTDALVSALRSAFQTDTAATQTGVPLRSWMHSKMPDDDCWTRIPELIIRSELADSPSITVEITPLTG